MTTYKENTNESKSSPKRAAKYLFCGAFKKPKNGTAGGVLYACTSLLASNAAEEVKWRKVDSSQPLPPNPFPIRFLNAASRLAKSIWLILLNRVDATLIFTPFLTMSLLEKISIGIVSGFVGKPTVLTFRSEVKPLAGAPMSFFVNLGLTYATAIVCQSQEAALALREIFPGHEHKTHVIPNWIAPFENPRPKPATANSPIRVSFIGWLEPIKDVKTILRAFHRVEQQFCDWQLSICGDGSQKQELEELATELGIDSKIEFTGWIGPEQKCSILQDTDLFIMASLSEGMPNSIVEAMKYGIPIVATNVGGIPSLVEHEVNGYLAPAQDHKQMASYLVDLMANPETCSRISEANIDKIAEEHNLEVAASKIIELLSLTTTGAT